MARRVRWIVGARDGDRLSDVLRLAGADAEAVRDGRVLVGRRRARSADVAVKPGDEISITEEGAALPAPSLLVDADGLVGADKPADTVTIPDQGGASPSLIAMVALALRVPARGLHATSRLDRGVSGVVLFARTKAAAERLRAARERGAYSRRYVAITSHAVTPEHGVWDAPIGRAADARHRAVHGREATDALSRYAVVGRAGAWALVALEPITGRTHQLRVHAAHAGAPLVGDRVYGGPSRVTLASGRVLTFGRIALHAARVRVPRDDGGWLTVSAPIPPELAEWWRAAGGDEAAWDAALALDVPFVGAGERERRARE